MISNHATNYAHCITGLPAVKVIARGKPLVRFDTIQHRDGSFWRYEGMCRENTAVAASPPNDKTAIKRFSMEEFGLTISPMLIARTDDRSIT